MTIPLDDANAALRDAVSERLDRKMHRDVDWDRLADRPYIEHLLEQQRLKGDGITHEQPTTSQQFYDLCDSLKEMHRRKSADYGSAVDPLANIRNGAEFVGIEPWRAALVRLSDKVTRLQTYCRTGSLTFETFEDTCFDLASYALLTMLMHQESST
jgi:hypothetical protein